MQGCNHDIALKSEEYDPPGELPDPKYAAEDCGSHYHVKLSYHLVLSVCYCPCAIIDVLSKYDDPAPETLPAP